MRIQEVIEAINNRDGQSSFINDWSGVYDITPDEAGRIAEASESLEEFETIWWNEDWWSESSCH